jgi:hypothetical protein
VGKPKITSAVTRLHGKSQTFSCKIYGTKENTLSSAVTRRVRNPNYVVPLLGYRGKPKHLPPLLEKEDEYQQ